MPRQKRTQGMHLLTAREVMAAKEPGRIADGGNLYLRIGKGGTRQWVFMYQFAGRQREAGLGGADGPRAFTLAEARQAAAEMREHLKNKRDPLDARAARLAAEVEAAKAARASQFPTFKAYAADFIRRAEREWRNAKHSAQWAETVLGEKCRAIHDVPVNEVATRHVLEVLRPLWSEVPETARRLRQRLEMILGAAASEYELERANPARLKGHLARLLPKHDRSRDGHFASMSWRSVPAFVQRLRALSSVSARGLEFAILNASRSGEVMGATWPEFKLPERLWVIPKERMKAKKEHRVPLGDRALAILAEMQAIRRDDYVFRGDRGPLSNMAFQMLMRRLGEDYTPHGFRASFRQWVSDKTHFSPEIAEAALAHTAGTKTERAYQRSDLLERRREMMAAWEQFIEGNAP